MLIILICGAFLFSFFGVLFLISRTNRQERNIRELRRLLEESRAEKKVIPAETLPQSPVTTGDEYAPGKNTAPAVFFEAPAPENLPGAETNAAPGEAPYPAAFNGIDAPEESTAHSAAGGNPAPGVSIKARAPLNNAEPYAGLSPPAENAETPPPRQNRLFDALLSFVKGGNLWAAGGVVLLTIGFGTLIAYLGSRGFFTVEMGILLAAAAGLAMILSGWRFRKKRPAYFLILQGGGIGILYLAVFAAHKLTPHLGVPLSLALMSVLIPPAVIMALFQNSPGLAALGFLGGFAAPLLLSFSDSGGNHLFLFTYYTILNAGILSISFYRSWKGLNLLGFFFTFAVSLSWTLTAYKPEYFLSSEPFLLVFVFIFTVLGLRGLKNEDYRFRHYSDILLILGTPLAAAALQWKVFSFIEHGYAFIAIAFSAFYLALTAAILKKGKRAAKSYAEAYLALGALLANIAVPLELSPGASGALWAAEGALLFLTGLRASPWKRKTGPAPRAAFPAFTGKEEADTLLPPEGFPPEKAAESLPGGLLSPEKVPREEVKPKGDPRVMAAGLIVHLAAAAAFIRDIFPFSRPETSAPFRSPAFSGSLIIAVSALLMAVMAEKLSAKKETEKQKRLSLAAAVWGFIWWFGGWYFELRRVMPEEDGAFLILAALSGILCWGAAAFLRLKVFLPGTIPAPFFAALTVIAVTAKRYAAYYRDAPELVLTHNFFGPASRRGWLVFFVSQALVIFFSRKKRPSPESARLKEARIFTVILTALAVFSASGRAFTVEQGLSVSWTSLAGLLPLFAALTAFPFFAGKKSTLPAPDGNKAEGKLLFSFLPLLLSCVLGLWFFVTLFLPGNPSPLPRYIPVLNPLDLLEGMCVVSILFRQVKEESGEGKQGKRKKRLIVQADILVFCWIISILARSAHYYGAVPWSRVPGSTLFQLCLFIFWALYGILHIITGHRGKIRAPWITGAVLICVDIAKLIFFDMRDINAVPRILSFFGAGIILLFIGWAAPLPPPPAKNEETPGEKIP